VGRYTHRLALFNNRLLAIGDGNAQLRYQEYRSQPKTMTVPADEFIHFLRSISYPGGFHRIRYYGFLGDRHRKEMTKRFLQAIPFVVRGDTVPASEKQNKIYRDRYELLQVLPCANAPSATAAA